MYLFLQVVLWCCRWWGCCFLPAAVRRLQMTRGHDVFVSSLVLMSLVACSWRGMDQSVLVVWFLVPFCVCRWHCQDFVRGRVRETMKIVWGDAQKYYEIYALNVNSLTGLCAYLHMWNASISNWLHTNGLCQWLALNIAVKKNNFGWNFWNQIVTSVAYQSIIIIISTLTLAGEIYFHL